MKWVSPCSSSCSAGRFVRRSCACPCRGPRDGRSARAIPPGSGDFLPAVTRNETAPKPGGGVVDHSDHLGPRPTTFHARRERRAAFGELGAEASVEMPADQNATAGEADRELLRRDLEAQPAEADRVVVADDALLLMRTDKSHGHPPPPPPAAPPSDTLTASSEGGYFRHGR